MNKIKTVLLITGCLFAVNAVSQETTVDEPDSAIYLNEVVVNAYQVNSRLHQVPGWEAASIFLRRFLPTIVSTLCCSTEVFIR